MKNSSKISHIVSVFAALLTIISACSTGIESTKTIKMSRTERRETMPTAEESFISPLKSYLLQSWAVGKPFRVVDGKASIILELPSGMSADSISGHILCYDGVESRPNPAGKQTLVIRFRDGSNVIRYNTGRESGLAMKTVSSLDMPMMIDLDMVEKADSLLSGKKLWIKTRLWYDSIGNKVEGRKFVPVRIERVTAGDMVFPLRVEFLDENNGRASIYMNVKASSGLGAESRTFPTLFYMEDPKLSYPSITPEVWDYIQRGKVAIGMKKDECKLALGNPSDVNAGHNWNNLIDVWSYKDGTFLQFEDGVLVNYRH